MKKILTLILINAMLSACAQSTTHKVSQGETLYNISKKYEVSIPDILAWNNLSSNELSLGQELIISPPKSSSVHLKIHIVAAGETLYSIAKKYNVTVEDIKKWNKLENESLSLGQELVVDTVANKPQSKTIHKVQAGETLYSIAKDYEMSVEDLIRINKLKSNALTIDQQLIVTETQIKTEVKEKVEESNQELIEKNKQDVVHLVKPKETLFSISRIYDVPVSKIKQLNKLTTYEIDVNQRLIIKDKNSNESGIEDAEPSFLTKETGTAKLSMSTEITHDKYSYCLHKTLKIGTIVKITNMESNTSIYARVMGSIPKTEETSIGINQAVADKIGNGKHTFPVSVEYAK